MNQEEWLQAVEPFPMLQHVESRATPRQLILFAHACAQHAAERVPSESSEAFLHALERFADGQSTMADLVNTRLAMQADLERLGDLVIEEHDCVGVHFEDWPAHVGDSYYAIRDWADLLSYTEELAFGATPAVMIETYRYFYVVRRRRTPEESAKQANLLRDILGNPFLPALVAPHWLAWNDGIVPKVAQKIYEERNFEALPILADALEEAGCEDNVILHHCRHPGKHVPGCWVVDALLAKE